MAYDLARSLRANGAQPGEFPRYAELWIESRYRAQPLIPFLRAGFFAGYQRMRLPTVQSIRETHLGFELPEHGPANTATSAASATKVQG